MIPREKKETGESGGQGFSNPIVISLLLAAVTIIVFWPVTRCGFINFDDPGYFSANRHVLGGFTGGDIAWAFTSTEQANWHPLTWLSLMLDAELFGGNPFGPHLDNLLIHAANVVLLFLLLRRLTGCLWPCAAVAALFALHPLRVESVAWVAERKDVLSAFFGLLSLWCYARFVGEIKNPRANFFYASALVLFAFSLMSKPMLVTLPFVMLLLDFWPLRRCENLASWRLLAEKIPFFLLSAASCAVTFVAQRQGGAMVALTQFPVAERIENAFISYVRYLEKTFWPFSLATPYSHPGGWTLALILCAPVFFIGCCVAAFSFRKKFPFTFVGWFWFVGTLVPMIGLIQVGIAAMADRYTYFPSIGVLVIVVWAGAIILEKTYLPRPALILLTVLVFAGSSARTRNQIGFWRDDGTLFFHSLSVTKNNYIAAVNFGAWLSKNGRVTDALDYYNSALRMNPVDPNVLYDVGNGLAKMGRWDEAIADYHRSLSIVPGQSDVLDNLGFALAQEKQFPEAVTNFEAALKAKPDFADAHNNLATVLFIQGNYGEAARHFFEAARLEPDNPQIVASLGETFLHLGKIDLAAKCYEQAVQLQPDNQKFRQRLQMIRQHSN